MITFYNKEDCKNFVMTHDMINTHFSPPLERKGGIYLILERGDLVPYKNEYYIYLGIVYDEKNIPRDVNVIYKRNKQIRARKNSKNDLIKYLKILKNRSDKKHKNMNDNISNETKNHLKSDARKDRINELRKEREKNIRIKMIEYLGGKCCKCGTKYNLSFVHQNPHDKKASISKMIKENKPIIEIYEEVQKCDLYCEKCRQKMFNEFYT